MTALLNRTRAFEAELIELRRDLHRHPELSFQEHRSAEIVAERVQALGYEVRRGVGVTGVVAELRSGDGPLVALRADMDALPIQEENAVPYRSTVDGVMHACGHDVHMSMLVGAAHLLADEHRRGTLPPGGIRLLFQPSEERSDDENKSGAIRMLEDGALDGVDAVFGLHVGAHLPAGKLFVREGAMMAGSDTFRLTVRGRSAHAGRPEEGVDAIVVAAQMVLAAQTGVSRRISPHDEGVLHFGTVRGGSAGNVLADEVVLTGTVRYFDEKVRRVLQETLRRNAEMAATLGGSAELDYRSGYPPLVNPPDMVRLAREAAREALGDDAVWEAAPFMGAEDFAFMLQRAPGAFLWLGGALDRPREHHHPEFDVDEHSIAQGAAVLAACAMRTLANAAR
ncbi:MAG: M20 family metallopeptidase [Gemmatimonadota bacterium]